MTSQFSPYPSPDPYGKSDVPGEPDDLYAPWYGIGFGAAIKRAFKKMTTFKGYASRGEYWWFWLFTFALSLVFNVIVMFTSTAMYDETSDSFAVIPGVLTIIVLLISFAFVLPSLAVAWRRLHDAGFAGPWFFLSFIPIVGSIAVFVMLVMPTSIEKRNSAWE